MDLHGLLVTGFIFYMTLSPIILIYILGGGFKSTMDDKIFEMVSDRMFFFSLLGSFFFLLWLSGLGQLV